MDGACRVALVATGDLMQRDGDLMQPRHDRSSGLHTERLHPGCVAFNSDAAPAFRWTQVINHPDRRQTSAGGVTNPDAVTKL